MYNLHTPTRQHSKHFGNASCKFVTQRPPYHTHTVTQGATHSNTCAFALRKNTQDTQTPFTSFHSFFTPCSTMPAPNNTTTPRSQNALGNARATSLTPIQACNCHALLGYTDGISNARTLNRLRTATAMRCGGTFLRGATLAANRPVQKARKMRGRLQSVRMPGPSRVVMVT